MAQRLTREARGKWEAKVWFRVLAPRAFGFAEVGAIPANDAKSVLGRTLEISFYDITKDISQLPTKLKFQVVKVDGSTAYTQLKLIELTRDYIRSLVRRGTSKVDTIVDVTTADNAKLRIMCMVVTQSRVKTSQKRAIRKMAAEYIIKKASSTNFNDLIQEIVLGKMASEIESLVKKIYPPRKVEIRKVKVLTSPFEIPL
jgi:small subunit ribosomal protein S3Ae